MEALFAFVFGIGPACLSAVFGIVAVVLFIKVLIDRLNNEEDDYYSKNIHE